MTHRQHPLRRPLEAEESPAGMIVVQRRHEAVLSVKWNFVRPRQVPAQRLSIDPHLGRESD